MIQYVDFISSEEYLGLRRKVKWFEFPVEEAQAGIDNSYMVKCARDNGKAVGVVRLLWDGGYLAFLADVIVDPEYQGQGLGRKVMENLMSKIKGSLKPGYKVMISLLAVKGKEGFYKKFDFVDRPNEAFGCGMHQWIEGE